MKNDVKEILLKIKQLYKNNKSETITQIRSILAEGKSKDDFFEKYPELKDVFDGLGNNPIESPELYVEEADFALDEYVALVDDVLKINLENYELEDALNFAGLVWTKVNSFRDETGHIKSTKNTEHAKMPNTKNLVKLSKLEVEKRDAFAKTQKGYDPDIDDFQEYAEEVTNIEKHYDEQILKTVLEITGIDGETLTDWEKRLLVADVKAYTKDSVDRGRTSFKGYL